MVRCLDFTVSSANCRTRFLRVFLFLRTTFFGFKGWIDDKSNESVLDVLCLCRCIFC